MVACARKHVVDESKVGIYHVHSRCVRRAFLCGQDPVTGKDYSHRRQWIHDRLKNLASCFAIDIATHAVLQNHVHVILRNRPDVAGQWSDEEVARRWLRLSSQKLELHEVDPKKLKAVLADPQKLQEYRRRLSSPSWFMRYLNEPVARMANAEDGCSGRFWEERFRCQRILDEASLLACSVYVDLNLIRAMMAETPEQSRFTSAYDRIQDRQIERQSGNSAGTDKQHSGWLAPISLTGDGFAGTAAGRRISDDGLFDFGLDWYLELVDWSGRQIRADKHGAIPAHLAPILDRLHVKGSHWLEAVTQFGRGFHQLVGRPASLAAAAAARGKRWLRDSRLARTFFH